ncbi:hypothetical protein NBRC116597_10090 [Phaeobacter sp. NW0010-22]
MAEFERTVGCPETCTNGAPGFCAFARGSLPIGEALTRVSCGIASDAIAVDAASFVDSRDSDAREETCDETC